MNMQPTNVETVLGISRPAATHPAADPWLRFRLFLQRLLAWRERRPRRLRLCESLSLGDRRFVAVLEWEGSRFLLGATASSLTLLSRLDHQASSHTDKSWELGESR